VADLRDFEDLNEILQSEVDGGHSIYISALKLIETNGIPYRSIRFVGFDNKKNKTCLKIVCSFC